MWSFVILLVWISGFMIGFGFKGLCQSLKDINKSC